MCANFTEWLDASESGQAALDATAPPAFLSTAVTSKLDPIEAEVTAGREYQFDMKANNAPLGLRLFSEFEAVTLLGNFFVEVPFYRNWAFYAGAGLGPAFTENKVEVPSVWKGKRDKTTFAWNVGTGLEYAFDDQVSMGFGYRYRRQLGRFYEDFQFARKRFKKFQGEFNRISQVDVLARFAVTERWALSYRGGFSFEEAVLLANRGGIEYFSRCGCWSAGIEVAQSKVRGVSVRFLYSITGIGKDALQELAERRRRSDDGFLDAL